MNTNTYENAMKEADAVKLAADQSEHAFARAVDATVNKDTANFVPTATAVVDRNSDDQLLAAAKAAATLSPEALAAAAAESMADDWDDDDDELIFDTRQSKHDPIAVDTVRCVEDDEDDDLDDEDADMAPKFSGSDYESMKRDTMSHQHEDAGNILSGLDSAHGVVLEDRIYDELRRAAKHLQKTAKFLCPITRGAYLKKPDRRGYVHPTKKSQAMAECDQSADQLKLTIINDVAKIATILSMLGLMPDYGDMGEQGYQVYNSGVLEMQNLLNSLRAQADTQECISPACKNPKSSLSSMLYH